MAITLQTRHILPMLKERGVQVSRGSLAAMSDLLGLRTRERAANEEKRQYLPAEVELVVAALILRRRWRLSDADLRALLEDTDATYAEGLLADLSDLLATFRQSAATVRDENPRWPTSTPAMAGAPAAEGTIEPSSQARSDAA